MSNLLYTVNKGIATQTWTTGLTAYTQSNCQVSLTANGYRIYRPANINPTDQGQTMWGGLQLRNISNGRLHEYSSTTDNIWGLTKNHSYIMMFHISGQSSNAPEFYWTNQCGWGGGGLSPSPTTLRVSMPSSNFNGEFDAYYAWSISDNIVKTCTSSYSYAEAGKDYLSYCDFKYGFGYTNTGSLGTDIYITNIRMFDITNMMTPEFKKSGIVTANNFTDKFQSAAILYGTEIQLTDIIEN